MSISRRDGIICTGVSTMDLFLINTKPLTTPEGVAIVESVSTVPGGCTSNTGRMVASLGVRVELLTLIGEDSHGNEVLSAWKSMGIGITYVRRIAGTPTALSTLPVYSDGKRGLYFCTGTNKIMDLDNLLDPTPVLPMDHFQVFHYGYPHLTPVLQRKRLADLFGVARQSGVITSLDVNGANDDMDVVAAALPLVDVFHANVEEGLLLTGKLRDVMSRIPSGSHHTDSPLNVDDVVSFDEVTQVAHEFIQRGVALVTITLGGNGVLVVLTDDSNRLEQFKKVLLDTSLSSPHAAGAKPEDSQRLFDNTFTRGRKLLLPAFQLQSTKRNTTGAGDGFVAGLLCGLCKFASEHMDIRAIVQLAQRTALSRISDGHPPSEPTVQIPKNSSISERLKQYA